MKFWQSSLPFVAYATTLGLTFSPAAVFSSQAQSAPQVTFECKQVSGEWTTVAKTPQWERQFIRWVSNFGDRAGYTPQRRCNEVTNRMNYYTRTKHPQFLTTGVQSGYNIVCVTDQVGNGCQGLLYTLQPDRDPNQTLRDLLARSGSDFDGQNPLVESRGCRMYVNIRAYLERRASLSYPPNCR